MNGHGIDLHEEAQQNHGLITDRYSELKRPSALNFGSQQQWSMGTCVQESAMDGGDSEQRDFESSKSTSSIVNLFESPASAFFATERCMGFPQFEFPEGSSCLGSHFDKTCDSFSTIYQSSAENFSLDSAEDNDTDFEFRNTLQSVVKSQLCKRSYNGLPKSNFPDNKVFDDCTVSIGKHCPDSYKGFPEHGVCYNSNSYSVSLPNFSSPQEKHSPRFSCGGVSVGSGSSSSNGNVLSSKTRIRWTQDLHEKFVDCINHLGGAEKATPKAILKLMDSEGLTIFHVKSHLQKYRIAKYMPDSSEGKPDKTTDSTELPQLDVKTGMQIREALQLQLDVQRRLHEQLEIQRKLQLQIEEQGRQLKMMFDQQQETSKCLFRTNSFKKPIPNNTSSNLDDPPISMAECYRNTQFHSKIS